MKLPNIIFVVLLLSTSVLGQSIYIEDGQQAVATALSWSVADSRSAPGGTIAYSHNGFIDVAVASGKMSNVDISYQGNDGRAVTMSPQLLSFSLDFIKKPEQDNNWGMSFLVGHQRAWASEMDPDVDRGTLVEYDSKVYSVGVEAYWVIPMEDPKVRGFLGFSPSASIGGQVITYSTDEYESAWDYSDILMGLFGIGAIAYEIDNSWIASIECAAGPSYSLNNQEAIQTFSFGFALVYTIGS